jgi:hypothetical protein
VQADAQRGLEARALHATDPEKQLDQEEALSQMAYGSYVFSVSLSELLRRTIILAGHETSANTYVSSAVRNNDHSHFRSRSRLTWLFYQLARHPADQEKLLKEIQHVKEQKGDEELTANDFEAMPFLNAVIKV